MTCTGFESSVVDVFGASVHTILAYVMAIVMRCNGIPGADLFDSTGDVFFESNVLLSATCFGGIWITSDGDNRMRADSEYDRLDLVRTTVKV